MNRSVRVVVVLDCRRGTVHGITTCNDEAARWCGDLADRYNDNTGMVARQFVGVVPVKAGTWWEEED